MKKLLLTVTALVFGTSLSIAQIEEGGYPLSMAKKLVGEIDPFEKEYAGVNFHGPNMELVAQEDAQMAMELNRPYRIGILQHVNLNTSNSGTWMTLADGTKVWRLRITSRGAKSLALNFSSEVNLPEGGKLFAYNKAKNHIVGSFTSKTDGFEALQVVEGEEMTLEYTSAPGVTELPRIEIQSISHNYRGFESYFNNLLPAEEMQTRAENCQVDVACTPESTGWTDQVNSVVHYTFNDGTGTYVCSGATINNTSQNCTPYILTAWHCGERQGTGSSASLAQWTWYWKYQKATCSPGTGNQSDPSPGNSTMTGGALRASSGNGTLNNPPTTNEVAGSDFYLVQLNSQPPSTYNVYYAGWDRTDNAGTSGKGIHHPAGSAKKISTYSAALQSATYNGGATNAHWRVTWVATTNGHGVTEGGSSGSPIFNQNKLIVGQLSGGSSFCNATSQPDLYGKMFTNWDQCGTADNMRLKPWLDPNNTGATTLAGIAPPCAVTPVAPVAQFTASATNISVGTTVQFTDQSTGTPTSWSWTVSPATGWSFAGGTSATSQNPSITFTTAGSYTITLTATNAQGSDSEVKNNYIVVTTATAPCAATANQTCGTGEEYIKTVTFNTINNTTSCSQYTNTNISTTVTKGQQYTLNVQPHIVGNAQATAAYQNDQISVWIDYNNNLTFENGEKVGDVTFTGSPVSTEWNVTIPQTAITGTVWMRARIAYVDAVNGAPMDPCGTAPYGETEDYKVVIQAAASSLNEANPFEFVAVYPNPANNDVSIDLTSFEDQNINVELIDLTGKVIASNINVAGTVTSFDLTAIAKGTYQVRISTPNVSSSKRIVKM